MIEVKRNESESSANLIRRFTKKIQQSGVLKKARSIQFNERPESALQKKAKAIKRTKKKEKMDNLWKLGKIERKFY